MVARLVLVARSSSSQALVWVVDTAVVFSEGYNTPDFFFDLLVPLIGL